MKIYHIILYNIYKYILNEKFITFRHRNYLGTYFNNYIIFKYSDRREYTEVTPQTRYDTINNNVHARMHVTRRISVHKAGTPRMTT